MRGPGTVVGVDNGLILVGAAPVFAEGWIGILNSTGGGMDLGTLPTLWLVSKPLYLLGGTVFGIATFRARILPRWAGALLAIGTAMGPLAALLPLELQPKIAIPVGLALVWLGYSLWAERREKSASLADMGAMALRSAQYR